MAIARKTATPTLQTAVSGNLGVTLQSPVAGNVGVIAYYQRGATGTLVVPTGWVGALGSTGGGLGVMMYAVRALDGTEGTTVTITSDGTTGKIGTSVLYTGVDLTDPTDVEGTYTHSVAGVAPRTSTGAAVVIANANALLLHIKGCNDDYATGWTPTAGMSEVFDFESLVGNDESIAMDEQFLVPAGSTGAKTSNVDNTASAVASGILIALKEAAAPPPGPSVRQLASAGVGT